MGSEVWQRSQLVQIPRETLDAFSQTLLLLYSEVEALRNEVNLLKSQQKGSLTIFDRTAAEHADGPTHEGANGDGSTCDTPGQPAVDKEGENADQDMSPEGANGTSPEYANGTTHENANGTTHKDGKGSETEAPSQEKDRTDDESSPRGESKAGNDWIGKICGTLLKHASNHFDGIARCAVKSILNYALISLPFVGVAMKGILLGRRFLA